MTPGEVRLSSTKAQPAQTNEHVLRFEIRILDRKLKSWSVIDENPAQKPRRTQPSSRKVASGELELASPLNPSGVKTALARILELKLPLAMLGAKQGQKINLRFTLWRQGLPLDALPADGSMELEVAPEEQLANSIFSNPTAD